MPKLIVTSRLVSLWTHSLLLIIIGLAVDIRPTSAQETTNPNGSAQSSCPPATAPATKVTHVYKEVDINPQATPTVGNGTTSQNVLEVADVQLGDVITVEVQNLTTLLSEAACTNQQVVLYLDERPLKDITAYPPTDPTQPLLRFLLERTESSRDVWTYVLGAPTWSPRVTKVSIGMADKFAVASTATINLKVLPHKWFAFWCILFLLILTTFGILAWKSDVLRDTVAAPGGSERRPFSLARTQAAWWFFLILASYLLIGIITGDFNTTITGTVLGLLGISAGTVVGSAIIDASKSSSEDPQQQVSSARTVQSQLSQLETEIQTLKADAQTLNMNIQDLEGDIRTHEADIQRLNETLRQNSDDATTKQALNTKQTELNTKQTELNTKQTELNAKRIDLAVKQDEKATKLSRLKKLNNHSENFLMDILSDAHGVSFHRFQIAAWTFVLGIIFAYQVYEVLAMPTFDASLLALLGISSGTYLGLKIPEDQGKGG
jgi:hypothetical protein